MERAKAFGVRTKKRHYFHKKNGTATHNRRKTDTITDDFCLHTLHTPLHHIGYFFDVQDCCLKRTQFLACGAPPLAVVTFESNLNDESKSSCWSLLAREKKSRRCVEKKRVVAENGQQQTTNDFGGM